MAAMKPLHPAARPPRLSGAATGAATGAAVGAAAAPPAGEAVDARQDITEIVDRVLVALERQQQSQRLPTATYRVQFNANCTFRETAASVPYLYTLGISDLYASPFLKARPGSLHGYDIVDHSTINPEIGSLDELRSLRSALREHQMGLLADVVPNHMSNAPLLNAWWQDVLENGPSSTYAAYFDIDWMPLKPDLAYKVLLPVLGDQFGQVLEDGQLVVCYESGAFWLNYFEQRFPLAPRSYILILAPRLEELQRQLGEAHADVLELLSIQTAIKNLPPRTETDVSLLAERRREKEIVKRRLHELVERSPEVATFVAENVRLVNGRVGDPHSFDLLDELLREQPYRLAYWRVAADEINYRRFFDINELAAICTEYPQVFAETHQLLFQLLDEGTLTGLRIDHPDGLYDPRGYLCQLQERQFLQLCRRELARDRRVATPASPESTEAVDERWQAAEQELLDRFRAALAQDRFGPPRPLYVVVEKILAHDESLPENWPVAGTVGYEFLNAVNGLFVDSAAEPAFATHYARLLGHVVDFEALAYQCKRLIVKMSMASELQVLGYQLDRISERNRRTRDFTLNSLTRALQEIVACFSVYRTYVEPGSVLDRDVDYVGRAVSRARRHNPAMSASTFEFIERMLLMRHHEDADDEERRQIQRFVGRFQQLTGPIMAKAIEDTAFYRYNRLASLNEVGGHPARFGTTVAEFHALNTSRLPRWAHTLNATSTHDTKRSEDVRTRIDVLTEVPRQWREHVQRWSRWHRRLKAHVEGVEAPSRNSEYLLYQTLVGIWPPTGLDHADPPLLDRVQQYMLKVVREAKVNTSWISPNQAYEAALADFVAGILGPANRHPFLSELAEFAGKVAVHGGWNSLAQLLLKIGAPGVPDFYQGTELWNLTLVDPDNRRPVNLAAGRRCLDQTLAEMAEALGLENHRNVVETWLAPPGLVGAAPVAGDAVAGTSGDAAADRVAHFLQRLLDQRADGRVKQFTTLLALRTRRQFPELFTTGDYQPLTTTGRFADRIVAFARRLGDAAALVIAPRLTVGVSGFGGPPPLGELWEDTAVVLPAAWAAREFQHQLTRQQLLPGASTRPGELRVADVLRWFPIGLLIATHPGSGASNRTH